MTTLITGGSGFIGLNVVELLLREGEEVVLFAQTPPPIDATEAFARLAGRLTTRVGDVRSAADLDGAFATAPIKRVIHAAAVTANLERERAEPRMIMDVNLNGAIEVLEAMRRAKVSRLLLASSVAVYGFPDLPPGRLCEETACPAPATLYGISKLAAEQTIARLAVLHDIALTIARIGPAYGPWEHHSGVREVLSPQWQSVALASAGRPITFARSAVGDWLYARDAAAGLIALLKATALRHTIYNVGSGVTWSMADWAEAMGAEGATSDAPPTVRLQSAQDRPAMAIARIIEETDYAPRYGLASSLSDYLAWLDAHPGFPRSA